MGGRRCSICGDSRVAESEECLLKRSSEFKHTAEPGGRRIAGVVPALSQSHGLPDQKERRYLIPGDDPAEAASGGRVRIGDASGHEFGSAWEPGA